MRSTMSQVLRWLLPSPHLAKNRYALKKDLCEVSHRDFFVVKRFEHPSAAAKNLIRLVGHIVSKDVTNFSPKSRPQFDSYPTFATKDPSTGKVRKVSEDEYMSRFRGSWAWTHLAKSVARYVRYKFEEPFMKVFNDPDYHVSKICEPGHT